MAGSTRATITVPAIEATLDLSTVQKFRNGQDGQLIAISYQHEPFYPHLSGPVLHFRLPDNRVVHTLPTSEGYELRWQDGTYAQGEVDQGAAEVVHLMWDEINGSFQQSLLEAFGTAAVKAIAETLEPR